MLRLKDKTAIVTGGASGFGAGIARKFAAEGAQVMVVDLNHDGAMELAEDLGRGSFGHAGNVADGAQVAEIVDTARDVFGEVVFDEVDADGVVFGGGVPQNFLSLQERHLRRRWEKDCEGEEVEAFLRSLRHPPFRPFDG